MVEEEAGSGLWIPLPGDHMSHSSTGYPWRVASQHCPLPFHLPAAGRPAVGIIVWRCEGVKHRFLIHCF